jgi:hypothetical protein
MEPWPTQAERLSGDLGRLSLTTGRASGFRKQLALRGGDCKDSESEASHDKHQGHSFVVKRRVR